MVKNKYWKVELEGTELKDFSYVKAQTEAEARKKVYDSLKDWNGGDRSLIPGLKVKEVSLDEIKGREDPEDYQMITTLIGTGTPLFDFDGFIGRV